MAGIISVWNALLLRRPVTCGVLCVLAALLLNGCSTARFATMRAKSVNPLAERLRLGDRSEQQTSARTRRWLQQSGAAGLPVAQALRQTRESLQHAESDDGLHAAAELSYLTARQTSSSDPRLAEELFLDSAAFAWRYLCGGMQGTMRDPNAPSHRATTEIYNSATEAFVRQLYARRAGDHQQTLQLQLTGRCIQFEVPHPTPWLHPDQVGQLEFVSDYELENLRNHHVTRGVGVPLMILRKRPSVSTPLEKYYAEGLRFPATAVLRFPTAAERQAGAPVRLQVYDPRETDDIVIGSTEVPLETDLSMPLARFLTNPDLQLLDTFAFLRPDKAEALQGLYMVQPYDPNRIPVLMIHGLWSSPMTWMEMFNDLQADPVLRDHYQFWFYMYPTGEPVAFNLADLRDDLNELRQHCDPYRQNDQMDQMVLVGHSMGGLLSYLMTVDSGDGLWKSVSQVPLSQLEADAQTRKELERVFFFDADPSVDRIVTIASPFRGSGLANRFTRWVSQAVVSVPERTMELTRQITGVSGRGGWEKIFTPRTSLDSLAEQSAVLTLVGRTTTPDYVEHHNIYGSGKGCLHRCTDGVVRCSSSRRSDVESELNIEAGHSDVHRNARAIAEVRAVLMEHLQDNRRRFDSAGNRAGPHQSVPAVPKMTGPIRRRY